MNSFREKISLCLCWGYLPHNTDSFSPEDAESKEVNKMSQSVACQWTSLVTKRWLVFPFRSSLRPFSGFGLFAHICKDSYFFADVPDPMTTFYIFSKWLYCHCCRIMETKSRNTWARKLLSCSETPSFSSFTLRPGK